jgi:hypothetical protein
MNRVQRQGRRANAVLLVGVATLLSCHRSRDDGAPGPGASAAAHDRLAPGELVDGPLRAFELRLPAGVVIREAFTSVVYAWGPVDPMKLANYLRGQVQGGTVSVGAAATVFEQVTVPSNGKRLLRIRVETAAQGHSAQLEVRDITPPPQIPAADDAERWRRVGMTPDGKLLDPTHLH